MPKQALVRAVSLRAAGAALFCLGCSSAGAGAMGLPPSALCPELEESAVPTSVLGIGAETPACPEAFDPAVVLATAMEAPIGWAAVADNGLDTTTGGLGGQVVLATTLSELKSHAASPEPLIIAVCGSLGTGLEEIEVESNKTILGVGVQPTIRAGFDIDDASNIVVRNLFIQGLEPLNSASVSDGIAVRNAHHVWLDHLDISDSRDGNLDVSNQSNYVTISYNRFWYRNPARAHRFSNLIGSSDDSIEDRGLLKVTLHHNWWADNVVERMPRARFGDIHVFGNYYSSRGSNYCVRAGVESRILVEGNYFSGVADPLLAEGGNILERGNIYDGASGARLDTGRAFEPPYPYELEPTCEVPANVTTNAGPR